MFSVALSVRMPRGIAARVYLLHPAEKLRGIAPCGVRTFLPWLSPEAIFRLSKIDTSLRGKANFHKHSIGVIGVMN